MNGPMYLRDASSIDVVPSVYVQTFFSGGERAIVYDGKRGFVSPETLNWMKTATADELGAMRVMRVTSTAAKGWAPTVVRPEATFRYAP